MQPGAGQDARDAARLLRRALGRYLEALAGHHPGRGAPGAESGVLETGIQAESYSLRFRCGVGRMGRIEAVMDAPYPHRFLIGRLQPGGGARLCEAGAALFIGYLDCEGLLDDVLSDLEEAVALSRPSGVAPRHQDH